MIERSEDIEREKDFRQGVLVTLVRQALGTKRAQIGDFFPRIEKLKRQKSGDYSTLVRNLKARNEALKAKK